jgi:ubiquinone/menaquinone biosynthesis C-methylase UbiE
VAEPGSERLRVNRARYDRMARYYALMLRVASLGQISRLYRAVAASLEVPVGGTLVELGCGPGTVTPHLRAALDPATRIVGVDFSSEMIARARRRAAHEGLRNVTYVQASALEWQPEHPVDAVAISLALTVFPEPLRCLDRALTWLRPGGQLVVLDSFLIPGRHLANLLVRAKAPAVGAEPESVPLDALLARLQGAQVVSLFGGSYTLVSGRVAAR